MLIPVIKMPQLESYVSVYRICTSWSTNYYNHKDYYTHPAYTTITNDKVLMHFLLVHDYGYNELAHLMITELVYDYIDQLNNDLTFNSFRRLENQFYNYCKDFN